MQPSADISQNLGTQLIFQLIDVSISNKDEMCSASQLVANEHKGLFNDKTVSTFRLIVRFKQQYPSKTISNAKLDIATDSQQATMSHSIMTSS
jgi:hypothetical protein